MKRPTCDECGLQRNRVVPIMRAQNGDLVSVCIPCYRARGYAFYMWDHTNALAGIPPRSKWRSEDDWR